MPFDQVKQLVKRTQFGATLLVMRNEINELRRVKAISGELCRGGCVFANYMNMLSKYENNTAEKSCHVIGSGWSVASSFRHIDKDDFVIGINLASYLPLHFNAYFIENASLPSHPNFAMSQRQFALIQSRVDIPKEALFFKNIWENKNSVEHMIQLYGRRATFVQDVHIPTPSNGNVSMIAERMLSRPRNYLRQYRSSVLTAIAMAYHLGFAKIIVHGVDFGGPYFFDEAGRVRAVTHLESTPQSDRSATIHPTATGAMSIVVLLAAMRQILERRGVDLLTATTISPSSRILPCAYP